MQELGPKIQPNCASILSVIFLGIVGVTAGILHKNILVVSFGLPLLIGPLILYALLRHSLKRLVVKRQVLPAVFEGDNVEVTIQLHNGSLFPVFFPAVGDVFTPEFHATKLTFFPYRVMPDETVEETYSGKCMLPRGIFELGPAVLALSDPFGWMQLRKRFPRRPAIKVYPRILEFGLRTRPGKAVATIYQDRTLQTWGESLEFFSVREYQIGDPPRRIHWPLTAHRGFPIVREFTQHTVGNLTIVLDLYRSALIGIGRGSSLEHAIKIAVAFANRALRGGHQVQVLAQSQRDVSLLPGRGLEYLQRILDLVVQLRPDADQTLTQVLGRHRRRLYPGDTVVYTVSPYLYESAGFFQELGRLRRLGMRQVAILFDERTFRALRYEESSQESRATEVIARLWAAGVEPYLVSCGAPLERVFGGGARG